MFECNAKITKTSLGFEDHGILSSWLHLDFGTSSQGFGGYRLDAPQNAPSAAACAWITGVLKTLEIDDWSKLPGTPVRVRKESEFGRIIAIGHFYKDLWFDPVKVFEHLK